MSEARPGTSILLTEEQAAVVAADPRSQSLTLAGPGTGKTHTLLARLGRLLENPDEERGQVLVLSFTRAVVAEIHERLQDTGVPGLVYLKPMTFDSFATRLLAGVPELAGWRSWEDGGYERRIEAATAAVREVPEATDWLGGRFDHVVVDEIQDLVGPRAGLVLEILATVRSFDLFGDPAQGIYGWQLQDGRDPTSDLFLNEVRGRFARLKVFELTENHRMSDEQALRCASMRPHLLNLDEAARAWPQMCDLLDDLETVGGIEDLAPVLRGQTRRTAILSRTNVEALKISEHLHAEGVAHVLRRGSSEGSAPGWLAQLCAGRRASLDRDTFFTRYEQIVPLGRSAEDTWELLCRLGDNDERIPLEAIVAAIRWRAVPDELLRGSDIPVVVSTVHRAKGLEFDDVIVVQPESWRLDRGDKGEESRVLFVATTRARHHLFHQEPVETTGWRSDPNSQRWYRTFPNREWMTLGFEIRGDDIEHMHPAGTWVFAGDALELQQYMAAEMHPGDELSLVLHHDADGEGSMARYVLHHGETVVGVTSDGFAEILARRLTGRNRTPRRWPSEISSLRFEGLDTVAGLEGVGADAGLGSSGLWLRPRPIGLGEIVWS